MVFEEDSKSNKHNKRKENLARLDKIRTKRVYSEESGDAIPKESLNLRKSFNFQSFTWNASFYPPILIPP